MQSKLRMMKKLRTVVSLCASQNAPQTRMLGRCLIHKAGRVKKKIAPFPGADSAQISPPWASMIFLHIASPTPVPE
jgi:hypothetical protein